MKILITGANGQLGHDLIGTLGADNDLFPFDLDLDVTDSGKLIKTIGEINPDFVIHCAAMTDVDGCETDPDAAFKVNSLGTANVALACRKAAAPMVYISTDFVFDGEKGAPYTEFDNPNPLSVYGLSKLAGERYVEKFQPESYIVRTAWLYGKHGHNFVKTILKLAGEQDELRVVNDQIGSPTYSLDLAKAIACLIPTGWYGTYHVTNQGNCSWYDFACEILAQAGKSGVSIVPINSRELGRPASRPAFSVLRNYNLTLRGINQPRPYRKALKEFLSDGPGV